MSETIRDFLVVGSTPFARLLAGLLAGRHGRSVAFVGESQSGYRLPRRLDLSVAPITRPESWAILGGGVAEVLRLFNRIGGREGWRHVDPIFYAEGYKAREAVSHIRHMARGFGIDAEPAPPSLIGPERTGVILRDAVLLSRPVLEPALDLWLSQEGVERLAPDSIDIAHDGSATLVSADRTIGARQTILADDEALARLLPPEQWPDLLRHRLGASLLTTPTRPLGAPVMVEMHSGTTLSQSDEGGIAATGPGDLSSFADHFHTLLGRARPVEQVGQTAFWTIHTRDGAPAVGRVAGVGADIVAGLGMSDAFFAPALARWLTENSTPAETAWFSARLVSRPVDPNSPVADFIPAIGDEPQ